LSNSKIAPKITSSDRVEIYMFNKKSKGKEWSKLKTSTNSKEDIKF
jgi:hypothetical protein